jgi:trehalose utilization protein
MTTVEKKVVSQETGGVARFLKSTFQTGLGAAESIHQAAMEVPLSMLQGVGLSEENTTALKEKHRGLLRSMYGSIDTLTVKGVDGVSAIADAMVDAVSEAVEEGEKGLKTVRKDVAEKTKG